MHIFTGKPWSVVCLTVMSGVMCIILSSACASSTQSVLEARANLARRHWGDVASSTNTEDKQSREGREALERFDQQ